MNVKIKILFDCHTLSGAPQGTTSFLAGLINSLPSQFEKHNPNHELEIICAASSKQAVDRYIYIPYSFVKISDSFLIRNTIHLPYYGCRLGVDYIVSQYVRPLFCCGKTVSIIHDVLFLDYKEYFDWRYRVTRWVLFGLSAKFSDFVFTVSRYSSERLSAHYGIKGPAVLPNAVDDGFSNGHSYPPTVRQAPITLLYVSRFESRKRQIWCVDLIHDLVSCGLDVNLILIGSTVDSYYAEFELYFAKQPKNIQDRISLRNNLPRDELLKAYSAASIFLFPSAAEGFGIPVIEAAAFAIPCVIASGSALDELSERFAGVYFDSSSYTEFLKAVQFVIERLNEFSISALEKSRSISTVYNWNNTASLFCKKLIET